MAKSLDRVLQPDGSYKWEEVELKSGACGCEGVSATGCSAGVTVSG